MRYGTGNGGHQPGGDGPGPSWPPPDPRSPATFGGYPPSPPPQVGASRTPRSHGRRPRPRARRSVRVLLMAGLLAGIGGLAVMVIGTVIQILPRTFTAAQRQQITAWEISKRWRTWTAGQIFPPAITYRMPGSAYGGGPALSLTARRIGIAPQASCKDATQRAAGKVLAGHGCLAVLRATYDDSTQTLAVTVGVAVLPARAAAQATVKALGGKDEPSSGIRAVSFRRTVTAHFGDRSQKLMWDRVAGPYLIVSAVGYADGRPWIARGNDTYTQAELLGLASGAGQRVAAALGAAPPAPRCPGSPAC